MKKYIVKYRGKYLYAYWAEDVRRRTKGRREWTSRLENAKTFDDFAYVPEKLRKYVVLVDMKKYYEVDTDHDDDTDEYTSIVYVHLFPEEAEVRFFHPTLSCAKEHKIRKIRDRIYLLDREIQAIKDAKEEK